MPAQDGSITRQCTFQGLKTLFSFLFGGLDLLPEVFLEPLVTFRATPRVVVGLPLVRDEILEGVLGKLGVLGAVVEVPLIYKHQLPQHRSTWCYSP